MKAFRLMAVAVAAAVTWGAVAAPAGERVEKTIGRGGEEDSIRVRVRLETVTGGELLVRQGDNPVQRIYWTVRGQKDEHRYVAYADRGRLAKQNKLPPTDSYPSCGIDLVAQVPSTKARLPCFNFKYWFIPYFDMSRGLYEHEQVVRDMALWRQEFKTFDGRELLFEFAYDARTDETTCWLDRQFAGHLAFKGRPDSVKVSVAKPCVVSGEGYRARMTSGYALPSLAARSAEFLRSGAKLVFTKDVRNLRIGGAKLEVWDPAVSVDQGRHRRTTYHRDFGWDPMASRTPWANGPEYMQWTVPAGFYLHAYVLCANIPEPDRVPVVGSSLTRFGASHQSAYATAFTDLSTAATNRNIRKVGRLEYKRDGRFQSADLYLVRQQLDIGNILHFLNDKKIYGKSGKSRLHRLLENQHGYLDFEFVGAGTQKERPRSSVHVFGCLLASAPYAFDIVESERGNIFENDEKPETGIEVRALEDKAEGRVAYVISDDRFNVLRRGEKKFRLEKAGESDLLKIDLAMPDVGWYMLDYTFYDKAGNVVAKHPAAFTLLGRNDREAGFESPFAAWPQGTGYEPDRNGNWGFPQLGRHNSNPNRHEVAELMHKAGYHTAWAVPVSNESEHADWQLSLSASAKFCNPPYWPDKMRFKPTDAVLVSNRIEQAVAWVREELARYPHCHTIQILHEQGFKLISPVLLGEPAVRGEYRGIEGNHLVYWATEYAKRLRKEFPDCNLQIGNGSSSSELVGMLAANGFDFNLVDTLGIESKGFSTMPEIANNLESPGMLWALRETAARFGYRHLKLNACNEYVFRPERPYHVVPDKAYRERMQVTDFSLRDYLISLAHGCWTISTGHLEDCNTQYYDTNWGAGGQCTFYPYSYPKRLFTALATLTKVMDRAKLAKVYPTGAGAAYALAFARDRREKDFAHAYWTARDDVELRVKFPRGARVRRVDWQGRTRPLKLDADGTAVLRAKSTPAYLLSSVAAESFRYEKSVLTPVPGTCTELAAVTAKTCSLMPPEKLRDEPKKGVVVGRFSAETVDDAELGQRALKVTLVRTEPAPPEVMQERGRLWCGKSAHLKAGKFDEIGIWVKGNGAFGNVEVGLGTVGKGTVNLKFGYRSLICHDGWQLLRAKLPDRLREDNTEFMLNFISFQTCRKALNPVEMVPVENDLVFGPVVAIRLDADVKAHDANEKVDEAMKQVGEKDL